jgi:NADPH-dependent curcumin reductase CurA
MATENRCWNLIARPKGDNFHDALKFTSQTMPQLRDGDVLIRNGYLSLDAGTRMWMSPREDSYQPPTSSQDLPVAGMVLGTVVTSLHPDYRSGDLVRAYGQWADFSVTRPDDTYIARLSWRQDDLRQYLAVFGPNGWTAHVGVHEVGQVRPGETFVVSSAAGVTGGLAGQMAKIAGCRVIGIVGSDAKCAYIEREFGFDGAINYRTQDVHGAMKSLCPNGVHVYFDNVAGPVLDAVLPNMAIHGRVAVCGLMTQYGVDEAVPGPYKYDQVLMKRLRIEGFFSPDFYHREPDFNRLTAEAFRTGRLRVPFVVGDGLESTVDAYSQLFTGANIGKVIVQVAELRGDN